MPLRTSPGVSHSSFLRGAAACLLLGGLLLPGAGCEGNGRYTSAHKTNAAKKMDGIKAATEYEMAMQAYMAGEFDKARKHVEYAIHLADHVARSHVLRGRIMLEKSDVEQAIVSLKKAEELEPGNIDAQYYQGVLAERLNRKAEAHAFYVKAGELDKTNPQYAIAAVEMLIDMDRVDEADSFLMSKRDVFQHSPGVQQTVGHIALLKGDKARAEIAFNEARLLAPDAPEVTEDLARLQYDLGKIGDAEYNLRSLMKDPVFAQRRDLQHMRARCLVALNRNAEARDLLVKLVGDEAGQTDIEAWISLGQVAYELKDPSRLRLSFSRAIALDRQRADGYVLKALHLQRTGDFKGALQAWTTACKLERSAENLIGLGVAQHVMGNVTAARSTFQAAAKADPRSRLARSLAAKPQLAEGIAKKFNTQAVVVGASRTTDD